MVLKPDDFTEQAQEILGKSQEVVRRYRHSQWDVEHVLMAILEQQEGAAGQILSELGVNIKELHERLDQAMEISPSWSSFEPESWTPRARGHARGRHESPTPQRDFISSSTC